MFQTLRSRLLITYLSVTGLVLALVAVSLLFFLMRNPFVERLAYARLQESAYRVQTLDLPGLGSRDTPLLRRTLDRLDARFGVRFLLVDEQGAVLGDSRPQSGISEDESLPINPETFGPQRGDFRDRTDLRWLWVSFPLRAGANLVAASPYPVRWRALLLADQVLRPLLQAAGVGLVVSLLSAWLISRWVAGPLQRMASAARAVAAGDYNQRISLQGPQEVRSVASSFNEMVERVQASQQAQRDFLANVSHELRTPLTSIQGFAQAIAEGAAAGQAGKEAARVIHRESDRLRRLVEELLDLARIESGQIAFAREPVELGQVLQGVCKRLALRAEGQGVTLQAELPELPVVIGDGDRLAQVFTNLLDNAIKHSPSESVVRLHGEVSRGWVTLHVDDRGMGIPEEELARIFERFYQVDKARGGDEGRGVGLGLAISQEIVQAHGGRIVVQSAVGDGTRFTVQLPVALPEDDTLVRGRTEEQAAGYLQGSRERSE